jgi:hypothetical protein
VFVYWVWRIQIAGVIHWEIYQGGRLVKHNVRFVVDHSGAM